MTHSLPLRSPLKYIGGKAASAARIVAAFPPHETYSLYVEPCGGAAHVLLAKPRYHHLEVYNDLDDLLVNFWQEVQRHGQEVQQQLATRPYARQLYYDYWQSLYGSRMKNIAPDQTLTPTEKAVRWVYILRSNMTGYLRESPPGWNYANAQALKHAAELIGRVSERIQGVAIDNRDAIATIHRYAKAPQRVFFYVDPPYIEAEDYYPACRANGGFDHEKLAKVLGACQHPVAISYYPHPMLDRLYPASTWRRLLWQQHKPSNIRENRVKLDVATELLLMNYPEASASLWKESEMA